MSPSAMAAAARAAAGAESAPAPVARGDAPAAYLDAVVAGNRRRAFDVVDAALAAGMDVRSLYLEVFQPALREVGRLWQRNVITVADEHLATAITQAAMSRLYERLFAAALAQGPLLVAACADSERHEVGLRMVCDLLEMEGWDTVFLGATVPLEDLVEMVRERRPEVVALSASIAPNVPRVGEAIRAIRAVPGRAPLIAVGGRAFSEDPGLAARLGADLTAGDAAEAAERLKRRFAA
ncbi:cobalamin B12-binding domain-containing protein [Longimicrobium sp.]|uniref:cobalamin B12-binding domain-containing protein n=1 Tax=Longimicrobium sp. TaxID=2029185 RepID=UPI002C43D0AF|nr:cobalamin-dependent protein [Longimicrobium sp.]HSU17633.1 cobalamin-dependent protein [Longimicrobium sp.]